MSSEIEMEQQVKKSGQLIMNSQVKCEKLVSEPNFKFNILEQRACSDLTQNLSFSDNILIS